MTTLLELDDRPCVRTDAVPNTWGGDPMPAASSKPIATCTDEYRCPRCQGLIPSASMKRVPPAAGLGANAYGLQIYCMHCDAGFVAQCGYQDGRVVQYGPSELLMGESLVSLKQHVGFLLGDIAVEMQARPDKDYVLDSDLADVRSRLCIARAQVASLEVAERKLRQPKTPCRPERDYRQASYRELLDACKYVNAALAAIPTDSAGFVDLNEMQIITLAAIKRAEPGWNGEMPVQFAQAKPEPTIVPESRADYVRSIKSQIDAETYEDDHKLDAAAGVMLDELGVSDSTGLQA